MEPNFWVTKFLLEFHGKCPDITSTLHVHEAILIKGVTELEVDMVLVERALPSSK